MPKPNPYILEGEKPHKEVAKSVQYALEADLARTILFHSRKINCRGVECYFIPLAALNWPRLGVKIYPNSISRDYAWDKQRTFAKKGLAPRVGGKFTISMPKFSDLMDENRYAKKKLLYCYVTELAENVGFTRISTKDQSRFKRAGYSTRDLHDDNVGTLNGKVVLIDFGPMSC